MTICESFYEALDKRLNKKMTIDDIGMDLCKGVKDPRGKVIRIIKEYKGEDWLIKNAEWLDYHTSKLRDITPNMYDNVDNNSNICDAKKNFSTDSRNIDENRDIEGDKSQIVSMLEDIEEKEEDKINQQRGICITGLLDEDTGSVSIRHLCYIDPYIVEGYYYVTILTFVNFGNKDEEDDNDVRLTESWNEVPYTGSVIDRVIDVCLYPNEYIDKVKKFLTGELEEVHEPPKGKSSRTDWKWTYHLSERFARPRFAEIETIS